MPAPPKPKRKATPGTRQKSKHGSAGPASGTPSGGGGWGGTPRPIREAFTAETSRLAISRRDDPEAQAVRDALRAEMLNVIVDVALNDESGTARANAADKVIDRLDGKAIARNEHAGEGGGALAFVMYGEPEAESAEDWQAKHAPKPHR